MAVRSEHESPKRQLMLDAGRRLFVEHGYGAVSMDAVAREAGVSKATLYAHFNSKDRLFATIITEACQSGMTRLPLLAAADAAPDIRAALTLIGRRMLRFLVSHQMLAIHRVVIAEAARFPELGVAFYENGPVHAHATLAAWLQRQAEAGNLTITEPARAADQFIAMIRGTLYHRAILSIGRPPTDADIEANVAAGVDTFLRAFGPGRGGFAPDPAMPDGALPDGALPDGPR